jgi:RNA polymerase sigma-70 factor (ECF subfamily)
MGMAVQVDPTGNTSHGNGLSNIQSRCDADSGRWLTELRDHGRTRDRAVRRLHRQLLRMAYARLLTWHPPVPRGDLDDIAVEAADDAVVAVLSHLDDFRGASRFTTWACQFAVTEVSAAMRKRRRRSREMPADPDVMVVLAGTQGGVAGEFEQAELLRCIWVAVNELLSARQRALLLALAIDGDSPEELAAAFDTTVGALYKGLHDARRKLRTHVYASGFGTEE